MRWIKVSKKTKSAFEPTFPNFNEITEQLKKEGLLVEPDADYIETRLSEVYDDILTLAREAQHAGFNECSYKLNDILGILDYIQVK